MKNVKTRIVKTVAGIAMISSLGIGQASAATIEAPKPPQKTRTLSLAAYTTPREVYGQKIIPAFQKMWKAKKGEDIKFEESYQGSGAQARAVKGGLEADIVALSLDPDVQTLVDAGLIKRNWKSGPTKGMVSRSIVVLGVKAGNPKKIATWNDLAQKGLVVLTPNPRTSGGAMWNIAALYGATVRASKKTAAADALLQGVMKNVSIMDKGARESMITFETGVADVVITYENEIVAARRAGKPTDMVIPSSTLLIENPVAVVDEYAKKHGTLDVADAFVAFLQTPEVQRMFADYGFRPVVESAAAGSATKFPAVKDLFRITDMGGWPAVQKTLFGRGGAFDRASAK